MSTPGQVTTTTRHLTASALVYDPRARAILLVHHNAHGWFQFPGGHVDPDESPDEAAQREVQEETGVRAYHAGPVVYHALTMEALPTPIAVYETSAPAKPHKGEPEHFHIDLLYAMRGEATADLTGPADEVSAVRWVPVSELWMVPSLRENVSQMCRVWLKRLWGHDYPNLAVLRPSSSAADGEV